MKRVTIALFMILMAVSITAQECADPANIYQFVYNQKSYEVVKQNMTWTNAAACAVERGGYLAEINNQSEQDEIYHQVKNVAGIDPSNTVAPDGGGASYVWLGGNDIAVEGVWIWDGNNDGAGPQFWQGTTSGGPVGGLYNNWGNEPDNWGNQDGLGLAITDWPLGVSGQWNDVDDGNNLYFIIEYDYLLGIINPSEKDGFMVYPNPAESFATIIFSSELNNIITLSVSDNSGKTVIKEDLVTSENTIHLDLDKIEAGIYIITVSSGDKTYNQKLVKN